jgi:hypothetical protein
VKALECMTTWPLLARNKVDDSKITVPVQACYASENEVIKDLAKKVIPSFATDFYTFTHSLSYAAARLLGYLGICVSDTKANETGSCRHDAL